MVGSAECRSWPAWPGFTCIRVDQMVMPQARGGQPVDAVKVENEALPLDAPETGQSNSPFASSERSGLDGAAEYERKIQTPAEREAKKALRKVEAERAMLDHAKAQTAFDENRERLKAERLLRETLLKVGPA
uniref:Uncharacterized protein n=1 Tax=Rhodopseudomonas palustris (strain BisA53) TaxID=316055 RepID=Q07KE8_RHOP5